MRIQGCGWYHPIWLMAHMGYQLYILTPFSMLCIYSQALVKLILPKASHTYYNSLDTFLAFYVNRFIDHYAFEIAS